MKKNIFKTLAAALCIGAFVLTGCTNNFEGTTPDFKQKKEAQTGNYGASNSAQGVGSVYINYDPSSYSEDATIPIAAKDSELSVTFYTQFEVDLDSVEKAFTFYKLKENTKTKRYYPEHDGEIVKTLLHVTEPDSYGGYISFLYRLDTESVTTNKIALVVDATKLKYKNGVAAVSRDGNLKAGEETDNIVKYISVTNKKDGTSTDPINNSYSESWTANNYSISSLSFYDELETSETDTTPSGKLRFYTYAPSKTLDADGVISTYDDGLADVLAKKFKLQIQKPGSTKWEAGTVLTFAYHSSGQYKDYDYYYSHTYTTDVDTKAFEQGTKWRIVCDKSVVIAKPSDWVKDAYGHAPFEYYPKVTTKVYPKSSDYLEIPYGDKDTTFIYAWGDSGTPGTFTKNDCTANAAFMTQNSFISWIGTNEKNIEVGIKANQVELDKTDGFILVDSKKTIVPSTTSVHKNADGKIDMVIITPKNDKLNLWWDSNSYDVYVGSGTTIKENPDYPKQVQFGCYPDLSKGPLSGYVLLAQNVIQQGTAFATDGEWFGNNEKVINASIHIDEYRQYNSYENRDKNKFSHIEKVYLLAGKTYHIQFANGYYNNPYLSKTVTYGNELCYYGQLYVYDADRGDPQYLSNSSYTNYISYNGSSATINCNKSGYYYICVNRDATADCNVHTNTGYNPITDDGYDWYYDAYCKLDETDFEGDCTFANPYYDDTDDSSPAEVDVTNWPLFFYPNWNETADGSYTDVDYGSHVYDDSGNPLMNPNPQIPYRWGRVYYHIYMD